MKATLQAGGRPFGVNRTGKARGGPRRSYGSNQVAERAKAVPDIVRAGRPRSRVGILHAINKDFAKGSVDSSFSFAPFVDSSFPGEAPF